MKKILAAAFAAALLVSTGAAQAASGNVQVGRLSCEVEEGFGLIIVSSKDLTCTFKQNGGKTETYHGSIKKLGLDIGFTTMSHIEWLVFSASSSKIAHKSLAGTYVGGSAEATLGVGLGANWLIGGSENGFALQPVSIQAQTGLNLSYAFAGLTLE